MFCYKACFAPQIQEIGGASHPEQSYNDLQHGMSFLNDAGVPGTKLP